MTARRASAAPSFLALSAVLALVFLTACGEQKPAARLKRLDDAPPPAPSMAAATISATAPATAPAPSTSLPLAAAAATSGTADGAIAPPPPVTVRAGGNIFEAAGIAFTIPAGWEKGTPSNKFRLAQYTFAGPGGPAEAVVFYFGPGQGGGTDQNIRRWTGQFKSDDATTTALAGDTAFITQKDGLKLAMVKCAGTFDAGAMPGMAAGAATGPKPGYALFGLVVEGGPEGSLFIKITGPKTTLDAQGKALEDFAVSARRSKFKG